MSPADPLPTPPAREALEDAQRLLRRVGQAEVRGRLHRTLVLWDLGYTREALSQFRVMAESALGRLLERLEGTPLESQLAAQRLRLERGQAARIVEWLYNDAEAVPARLALHLHTLLGWGNYASHHQKRGHHAEGSDLAVLLSVAIDLEEWLAVSADERSIFDADDSAWRAHEVERAGVELGLADEVARRFVATAGRGSRAEDDRLVAPHLALELFFGPPAGAEAKTEAASNESGPRRPLEARSGPYRGLQCFEPEDAQRFFGRDAAREQLVRGVEEHALTVLCGASGVGKTSLLRAGLIPDRLAAGCGVLWLATYEARALRTAMQVIGAWPADRLLVVVFDQLEAAMLPETPEGVRRGLLELLLRAERWRHGIRMVVSLREDFLGRLLREADGVDREGAAPLHDPRAFVALDALAIGETRAAITRPLEGSGVHFDEALLDELALALSTAGGTPPAQLQLICTRLYEQARESGATCIDHALYASVGGAEKILETHLDETLAAARYEGERELARTLLKAMTGAETRRWVDLGDLWQAARASGQPADAVTLAAVLLRLSDDRLIATRAGGPGGTVEHSLMHDQLAAPVREWRSAQELEQQQAQEILDRAVVHWGEPAERELLGGRQLKLVERHFAHLRRRGVAAALLAASRRSRLLKRATSITLAGLAIFGLLFGAFQLQSAVEQRDRALAAADQGVLLQARLALSRDPSLAVAWLRNLSRRAGGVGVLTVLEEARRRGVARVLVGHAAPVSAVAFSPDGKRVFSAGHDRKLQRWDRRTSRPSGPPWKGHRGAISCLGVSPDGKLVASGDLQNKIRLWDAQSGKPLGKPLSGHANWVYGLAFAPDGKLLASASLDGTIRLWSITSGAASRTLAVLRGHRAGVTAVAFSPDGKLLASASRDRTLRLWDVATRSPRGAALIGHRRAVHAVAFSPDGKLLVSAGLDATVRYWDPTTGRALGSPLTRHSDAVIAIAFSPDGRTLASAGEDKAVVLWNVETRRPIGRPLRGHVEFVRSLAFSPDGRTLASASQDQTVRLWDLVARRGVGASLKGHAQWVHAVAFSRDGKLLASATRDGTIVLWDRRRRVIRARLSGHRDAVVSLAFSPDDRLLASASHDRSVRLWPLAAALSAPTSQPASAPTSKPTSAPTSLAAQQTKPSSSSVVVLRDDEALYSVAFSPDGKLLATGGVGELRLWSISQAAATRRPQVDPIGEPLAGHDDAVASLAFTPNGKVLASAGHDGVVQLWDVDRRALSGAPLFSGKQRLHQLAFSRDGRLLAVGGSAATVQLFDVKTRRPFGKPLVGHHHSIYAVAFSPDGRTLASAGADATLRLWRVSTRTPHGPPLRGHTGAIYAIAFSPDGKLLASGSADRTVWLWQTASVSPARLLERIDALTNLHVSVDGKIRVGAAK